MKTLPMRPVWNLAYLNDKLDNTDKIGIIEYENENGVWSGVLFSSIDDKLRKIRDLKNLGYDYDKITYFRVEKFKLENPRVSENVLMHYEINYIHGIMISPR